MKLNTNHYRTPVWGYVIHDMLERNEEGRQKYNKYLTPDTTEDMLQHAYEEALDLAVYLKTQILKRDNDINQTLPLGVSDYT